MFKAKILSCTLLNLMLLFLAGPSGLVHADEIDQTRQILREVRKITQLQLQKQVELEKQITQLKAEAGIENAGESGSLAQTLDAGLEKSKQILSESRGRFDKIALKQLQDRYAALSSKMKTVGDQILKAPNYTEVQRFVNEKLVIPMGGKIEWTRQVVTEAETSLSDWRKDILAEPCRLYGTEYCI